MVQADSNNNTRRDFLTLAAAAATVVLSQPKPALAVGSDPILAAIEDHKVAVAGLSAVLKTHSALDLELPLEKCRSSINAWEEKIVETDDPRWIENERAVNACHEAETDAACALVNVNPTTIAGLLALLRYAVEADTDGEMWPRHLQGDDGKNRSWHHYLIENLAEALPDLIAGGVEPSQMLRDQFA